MFDWLTSLISRDVETRASGSGFTTEVMAARESYIAGRSGLGELTATAQGCVSLWENSLTLADVAGTDLMSRNVMAMIGRSLALRGEALFVIRDDVLIAASDWDLSTRNGRPVAYRVSLSEADGGRTTTALAAEVLHLRIGSDAITPWIGSAPLRRSALTAGMLHAIETALGEVFEFAPLGSQVVPFPESPDTNMTELGRSFRGQRGRVMLRESVHVIAAGGPTANTDWRPADVSPDLSRAMTAETLAAARNSVCAAFGVLPSLFQSDAQGPLVREAQRHLVQFTLQPIAMLIAEEASAKLGVSVDIDVMTPSQAYDTGGRARALVSTVEALARAKEAGVSEEAIAAALSSSVGIAQS